MSTRADRLARPEYVSKLKPLYKELPGICRVCTCTGDAIEETCQAFSQMSGCSWVEPDLCSTCEDLMAAGNSPQQIRAANRFDFEEFLVNVEAVPCDEEGTAWEPGDLGWRVVPSTPNTQHLTPSESDVEEALVRR